MASAVATVVRVLGTSLLMSVWTEPGLFTALGASCLVIGVAIVFA